MSEIYTKTPQHKNKERMADEDTLTKICVAMNR